MQILHSIAHMLSSITGNSAVGKAGVILGALLAAFFAPIAGLLVTCFATTTIDMIYGIKVARKRKQKITSDKNWRGTLVKILDEFVIISLARLIEMTVLGSAGVFVLTGGATIIISLTELWSIIENLNTLNPNGPWKVLGAFLKKKGEEYTGIELNFGENGNIDDVRVVKKPL